MRLVLLLLVATPFLCGAFDLSSADAIERTAHKLRTNSRYLLDDENSIVDKREELKGLIRKIDQKLDKESPDPSLLWLRGLAYRNYFSCYHKFGEKNGNGRYEQKRKELIQQYQSDYGRALDIAKSTDEADLPGSMVQYGSSDVLLTGVIKEKVSRYIIENTNLRRQVEKNHYSAMSSGYVEEGKYEEALRIINEKYEKFPEERDSLEASRKRLRAKIEGSDGKANKERQNESGSEDGKGGVTKGENAQETRENGKENQNSSGPEAEKTAESASSQDKEDGLFELLRENWAALGTLVIALIAGGLLVVRYRKK